MQILPDGNKLLVANLVADHQLLAQHLPKTRDDNKKTNDTQQTEINKQNDLSKNEKNGSAQLETQLVEIKKNQ